MTGERPIGSRCSEAAIHRKSSCKRPTPSQAHCSVCHRTFSGVWWFDEHRRDGFCVMPEVLEEVDGVWKDTSRGRPEHWT